MTHLKQKAILPENWVAAFCIFIPLAIGIGFPQPSTLKIIALFSFSCLMSLWLLLRPSQWKKTFSDRRVTSALAVPVILLTLEGLSTLKSQNPGHSAHTIGYMASAVILAVAAFVFPVKPGKICWAALWSCAVILGISLLAAYFRINLLHGWDILGSTLYQRNAVSEFLIQCLPLLLAIPHKRSSPKPLSAGRMGIFVSALAVLVIILNRTRTSWILLIFYSLYFGYLGMTSQKKRWRNIGKKYFFILSSAIVLFMILPNQLRWVDQDPYLSSLKSMTSSRQSSGRDGLWRNALKIFERNPWLGVGPGQFSDRLWIVVKQAPASASEFAVRPGFNCYNDYLQAAVESGAAAGLLMFLIGIGFPVLLLWGSRPGGRNPSLSGHLFALSSLTLGMTAMLNSSFRHSPELAYFSVCLALAGKTRFKGHAPIPVKMKKGIHSVFITFACLCGALLFVLAAREGLSVTVRDYSLMQHSGHDMVLAYRLWPYGENWISPQMEFLVSNATRDEAFAFLADQKRLWPHTPFTDYDEAYVHQLYGPVNEALDAYRRSLVPVTGGQCYFPAYHQYLAWTSNPHSPVTSPDPSLQKELTLCAGSMEKTRPGRQ